MMRPFAEVVASQGLQNLTTEESALLTAAFNDFGEFSAEFREAVNTVHKQRKNPSARKGGGNPAEAASAFFAKSTNFNKKLMLGEKLEAPASILQELKKLVNACDVKFPGGRQDLDKLLELGKAVIALAIYVHALFLRNYEVYAVLQQVGFTAHVQELVSSVRCNNETSKNLLDCLHKIQVKK